MTFAVFLATRLILLSSSFHYASLRWFSGGIARISVTGQIRILAILLTLFVAHFVEIALFGQMAFAIGNPFSHDQTLTTGIDSSLNRTIVSPAVTAVGIDIAAPVETINRDIPLLMAQGRYWPLNLGVALNDTVSRQVTPQLGIEGVLVLGVRPGSAAATTGLIPGDVIQQIDNHPIRTTDDLYRALKHYAIDTAISIMVFRQSEVKQLTITLKRPL